MPRSEPIFSIIIPVYNKEKYIEECIDSVESQTFQLFEIILVDDGSTDGSGNICKSISRKYTNVQYLYQNNSGPYDARLYGINHSSGQYLLFLDSDDRLRKDTLSILYDCITRESPDVIIFNMTSNPEFIGKYYHYPFKCDSLFEGNNKHIIYEALLNTSTVNNLATKCILHKLFSDVYFEKIPGFKNAEDLYCVTRIIDSASSLYLLDEALYYYRQDLGSTTHNYDRSFYDSIIVANNQCIKFAEKWGSKFYALAKKRCAKACIVTVRHIVMSELCDENKRIEIERVLSSDFFKQCIKYKPSALSIRELFIYYLLRYKRVNLSEVLIKLRSFL